jgi:hypothetical protein
MPKIDSYPRITSPQNDDLLLISDQSEDFDSKSISLSQISGVVNSGKQNQITLTTLGTDGPATFVGDVLNIPRYTSSGGGSGSGTITDIATTAPITGGPITSIGTIGITQASLSTDGYLSSTDFTTFNNKQSTSEKGAASGYAPLDANQKIPAANLPDSIVGAVSYQGTWNAQNNNPALPDPTTVQGNYYVTEVPGTYLSNVYAIGDWVISNGTVWEKVDNTQNVNSVFGRTGNVVADAGDYSTFYLGINDGYTNADVDAHLNNNGSVADNALLSWTGSDYAWVSQGTQGFVTSVNNQTGTVTLDTDDIAEGSSNLYYTDTRVTANTSVAANTAKVSFPGFGTAAGTALEGNTAVGQVQSLTTAGTSGAATLTAGVLNIPQYSGGGGGGVTSIIAGTNVTISPAGGTGDVTINASGGGGGVGGSGTQNYIPKWAGSTSLTDSILYDNGSQVAIGTNTPASGVTFQVGDGTAGDLIRVYGSASNSYAEYTGNGVYFYRQNSYLRPANPGAASLQTLYIGDNLGGSNPDRSWGAIRSNFNDFWFTNSGTKVMRIYNQKVGIGPGAVEPNVPTHDLHVDGDFRLTGRFRDGNNSQGTSGYVLSSTGTGTEWIANVGTSGITGSTTGSGSLQAITDIRTLTSSEYAALTSPAADVLYIVT